MPYITRPMKLEDYRELACMAQLMIEAVPQFDDFERLLVNLKKPGDHKPDVVPQVYGYVTEFSKTWGDMNNKMIVSSAMLVPTFWVEKIDGSDYPGVSKKYDYHLTNLMTNPAHRGRGCAKMCLEMVLQWIRQDYTNPNIAVAAWGYPFNDRQNAESLLLDSGFNKIIDEEKIFSRDATEDICGRCPVLNESCKGSCSLVLFELINRKDNEKLCVR